MDLVASLRAARIIPVVRVGTADEALEVASACVQAGLPVIEFTATTAGWDHAVRAARKDWPELVVGVGTILDGPDAECAADAGAHFVVSPFPSPEVRATAEELAVRFIEGGFTPAEVAAAAQFGPAKLFPAHVGGPSYLRSLLAVIPGAAIVPTGGIGLAAVPQWLAAGAIAVGVGSDLTAGGDIAERVEQALSGVDSS